MIKTQTRGLAVVENTIDIRSSPERSSITAST
jgi:hypothetical protein